LYIPRFVIPAEAGIQHEETPRAADKTMRGFRLRGGCLIQWIPAFTRKGQAVVVKPLKRQQPRSAGMTG
jgi:hypothetical protein